MHTFLAIVNDRQVFVDAPEWSGLNEQFPGWSAICRPLAVAEGLMTENEAKEAEFMPAVRPPPPRPVFR